MFTRYLAAITVLALCLGGQALNGSNHTPVSVPETSSEISAVAKTADPVVEPMSRLETLRFIEQETGLTLFSVTTEIWKDCNGNEYEIPQGIPGSSGICVVGTTHAGTTVYTPAGWEVNSGGACYGECGTNEDPVPQIWHCTSRPCKDTPYATLEDYCNAVCADPGRYLHW